MMLTASVCRCGKEMTIQTTDDGVEYATCSHCDQPCEKKAGACKKCRRLHVNIDRKDPA